MRRLAGSHVPNNKNRSSKHLTYLTKIKLFVRSKSNKYLSSHMENSSDIYGKELSRRKKKNSKNK